MTSNLRRGGRAVGASIGLAIAGLVAALAITLGISLLIALAGYSMTPVLRFLLFVPGFVMFVVVGLGYLRYRELAWSYVGIDVPSLSDLLWTGVGYVSAFAVVIISALILTAIDVEPDATNSSAEFGMNNPELLLWMIPLMLFVVAPAEEFLFRGIIQSRLRETFIAPVAIVIAAIVFATLHFFALTGGTGGKLIAISILFFPSLVFGIVYEKTGNLVTNTIVHGVYNSTIVVLLYVSLRFSEMDPGTGTAFL